MFTAQVYKIAVLSLSGIMEEVSQSFIRECEQVLRKRAVRERGL